MTVSHPMNSLVDQQARLAVDPVYERVDYLTAATRDTVESVLIIELRLATVAALAERFGARYLQRATAELQSAEEALHLADLRRRNALAAAAAELGLVESATVEDVANAVREPVKSCLLDSRAEFSSARDRIKVLRAKAEDILGRRITLVADALQVPGESVDSIYGRTRYSRPTLISNLL